MDTALTVAGAVACLALSGLGSAIGTKVLPAEDEHPDAAGGQDLGADHREHQDHPVEGLRDGRADVGQQEEGRRAVLGITLLPGTDGTGSGKTRANGRTEAGEGETGNSACDSECGIHSDEFLYFKVV